MSAQKRVNNLLAFDPSASVQDTKQKNEFMFDFKESDSPDLRTCGCGGLW